MSAGFEPAVERFIDAPPPVVFGVWHERLTEWWCPKPWTTRIIEHDFRSGGVSALDMSGPDGADAPVMEGVFLEIVPDRSIVITNAFTKGWIPQGWTIVAGQLAALAEGMR